MRDVVGRAARRMLYMLLKRVVRANMPRLALEDFGVPDVARLTAHRIVLLERNFRCTQKAKVSAQANRAQDAAVCDAAGDGACRAFYTMSGGVVIWVSFARVCCGLRSRTSVCRTSRV